MSFPTRRSVFLIALVVALAVIIWAFTAPGNLNQVGTSMQSWVVAHFGWLFSAAVVATVPFMLVVGYGPTGRIRLGADDSTPEYSTVSWISMLFAAGLGIGLIFYGPLEPLSHFLAPPPSTNAQAASVDAILPAMTTAILHQATFAWCIYALVGGSLAYASFRRGRLPLISSLFEPVFPNGNNRVLGKIIDVFSILVTLFAPRMHRKGIGTTPGANRPYPTSALRGDGAGLSRAPRADEAGYLRFWVDQYRGSGPRRR